MTLCMQLCIVGTATALEQHRCSWPAFRARSNLGQLNRFVEQPSPDEAFMMMQRVNPARRVPCKMRPVGAASRSPSHRMQQRARCAPAIAAGLGVMVTVSRLLHCHKMRMQPLPAGGLRVRPGCVPGCVHRCG